VPGIAKLYDEVPSAVHFLDRIQRCLPEGIVCPSVLSEDLIAGPDRICVVYTFIEGVSLEQTDPDRSLITGLSKGKRQEILARIGTALDTLHSHEFWHGDIQGGNVVYNAAHDVIGFIDWDLACCGQPTHLQDKMDNIGKEFLECQLELHSVVNSTA
jgi:tRNA A-37 threonylcarbamoyl transferase component Bud32